MKKRKKDVSMSAKHKENLTADELNKHGHEKLIYHSDDNVSLEEINNTVPIPDKNAGFVKTMLGWVGPGALVAVGYIDPGNWVTSIGAGAQFQYKLLTICLISGVVAMFLQSMCARLGIATGMDLAQATRSHLSSFWGIVLWVIAELAIMATDIAEIIGSGIALMLLFHIPLLAGIIITAFDVLLLLLLMKLGFRKIEAIVITLIGVVLVVFVYEVVLSQPVWWSVFAGYIPHMDIVTNPSMLYLALGIVGATVMPHNLYLHSSIVQSSQYDRHSIESKKTAIHFSNIDSNTQLSIAIVINSLLLILGASLFFGQADAGGTFEAIFESLQNSKVVGAIASPALSVLFAVALLASGQNSTITGTLSGQIVMEGFLHLRMPLWARRLVTRLFSIIPVLIFAILYKGNQVKIESLMTFSQVFLSIALPFSLFPLTYLTSDEKFMGKEFVNKSWVKWCAYTITLILTGLNIWLIYSTLFA